MAKTKRGLSEAERAERRARDRERLQHAARELLTSDGWQRWVRARALFHNYSLRNCLLLAAQCHERGIDARRVAGFRTWLKLGRCVRKGEKGLVVLAPMPIKRREDSEERDEARVVFRSAFVFADSQTDPLPGVDSRSPRCCARRSRVCDRSFHAPPTTSSKLALSARLSACFARSKVGKTEIDHWAFTPRYPEWDPGPEFDSVAHLHESLRAESSALRSGHGRPAIRFGPSACSAGDP